MTVVWKFEAGILEARNNDGKVICGWSADMILGQSLADLLNQNRDLARLILWPLWEDTKSSQI